MNEQLAHVPIYTPNTGSNMVPTIPKPSGEVTELNKGGYSLEKVLKWERRQYLEVQVRSLALP